MKPFWKSRTFWLNLAAMPAAALLTPVVGADTALKATVVVQTVANLVLRLFFTDAPVAVPGRAP